MRRVITMVQFVLRTGYKREMWRVSRMSPASMVYPLTPHCSILLLFQKSSVEAYISLTIVISEGCLVWMASVYQIALFTQYTLKHQSSKSAHIRDAQVTMTSALSSNAALPITTRPLTGRRPISHSPPLPPPTAAPTRLPSRVPNRSSISLKAIPAAVSSRNRSRNSWPDSHLQR